MSLLPASAIVNSGPIAATDSVTALPGTQSPFSMMQPQASGRYDVASAQIVTQQTPPTTALVSPSPPASAGALTPKLEYTGNALSDLNARAATIPPANAASSLQNRLDLLNSQFRALGDHLQESAAKNDPLQLLRLQNDIYQLDEELELVSKVVDQATSGVRSLLQTQI